MFLPRFDLGGKTFTDVVTVCIKSIQKPDDFFLFVKRRDSYFNATKISLIEFRNTPMYHFRNVNCLQIVIQESCCRQRIPLYDMGMVINPDFAFRPSYYRVTVWGYNASVFTDQYINTIEYVIGNIVLYSICSIVGIVAMFTCFFGNRFPFAIQYNAILFQSTNRIPKYIL